MAARSKAPKRGPVSRVLFPAQSGVMTIHLGRELPHGSSNLPGGKTGRLIAALFGFAPGGACLARTITRPAGELLPHPFTLTAV